MKVIIEFSVFIISLLLIIWKENPLWRDLLLLWCCILIAFIFVICFFVLWAEIRVSVHFIVNRGGLWLGISFGLNKFRMIGISLRVALGHRPRVWMRNIITGKYHPLDTLERVYIELRRRIEIPFSSIMNLGLKIIIRRLDVKAKVGIEDDAAATTLLCGMLLTFFETVRTIGSRSQLVPTGLIIVKPIFGHDCLLIQLKCMIGLKIKDVICDLIKYS